MCLLPLRAAESAAAEAGSAALQHAAIAAAQWVRAHSPSYPQEQRYVCHAGRESTPLKLLCKGKVLTNNMQAPHGLQEGAKIIVMPGSAPGTAPGTDSGSTIPAAMDVDRILQAVEAMSKRTSNPDDQYFQLFDQVRTCRGHVRRAITACHEPANSILDPAQARRTRSVFWSCGLHCAVRHPQG